MMIAKSQLHTLVQAPDPRRLNDQTDIHPYEHTAIQIADYLLGNQVVANDQNLMLRLNDSGEGKTCFSTLLIRRKCDPVSIELHTKPRNNGWVCELRGKSGQGIVIAVGEYFRVDLNGNLSALSGFRGIQPGEFPGPEARTQPRSVGQPTRFDPLQLLKSIIKRTGLLAEAARTLRDALIPEPRPEDLASFGGITWYLAHIDRDMIHLKAYDRGGIYDPYINAEGRSLPAQVPGNYYADAYAAYAFAWLHRRTCNTLYLEACLEALRFVYRVYPQYAPASIVWHHSDFKNPAIAETVEKLLMPDVLQPADLSKYQALVAHAREDAYSPTNVFALRLHWQCLRLAIGLDKHDSGKITTCLNRLRKDQTTDGLFHDNISTYPDAHDLSYHQYTIACLAQALAWQEHDEIRALFLNGVHFSLAVTTPHGEVAYVGRGANNVYHMASAVLAFEAAARLGLDNVEESGTFRRAARLIFERLRSYQQSDGMLPTAMNSMIDKRVAWNHCETPYNALSASMLMKASRLSNSLVEEAPLPMERPGYFCIMDDAGYAAVRTRNLYAVMFGGCAESYAWSEGKHRTGVSGIALLGIADGGSLLPILDHPTGDNAEPITDHPIIGGCAAYGRGKMASASGPFPALYFRHHYGGALLERLLLFTSDGIVVVTRVTAKTITKPIKIDGLVSVAVQCNPEWKLEHNMANRSIVSSGPEGALTMRVLYADPGVHVALRIGKVVTNPRGLACRVVLADGLLDRRSSSLITCHALQCGTSIAGCQPHIAVHRANNTHLMITIDKIEVAIDLLHWPKMISPDSKKDMNRES